MIKKEMGDALNYACINEFELPLSQFGVLKIRYLRLNEGDKIDVRIWAKYHLDTEFHPTKRGLMVETRVWKDKLIPLITKLIENPEVDKSA